MTGLEHIFAEAMPSFVPDMISAADRRETDRQCAAYMLKKHGMDIPAAASNYLKITGKGMSLGRWRSLRDEMKNSAN